MDSQQNFIYIQLHFFVRRRGRRRVTRQVVLLSFYIVFHEKGWHHNVCQNAK
jgi:hypothetical protein